MATNYYCLVSGLTEYELESDLKGFDALAIRDEIYAELTDKDQQAMRLLYLFYDVENIISRLNSKSSFNPLGMLSAEQLDEQLDPRFDGEPLIPRSLFEIAESYRTGEKSETDGTEEEIAEGATVESRLWEAYYAVCGESDCDFVRQWFAFDKNLRNICAAFTARRNDLPVAPQLVGSGDVTDALSRSSASDFGLKNEIEYLEGVVSLLEMDNILEKEHRLDQIRWDKAEQLTTFDYFNTHTLFAYLEKVNIIHRWAALDYKRGEQMLARLMEELASKQILQQAEQKENEKQNKIR